MSEVEKASEGLTLAPEGAFRFQTGVSSPRLSGHLLTVGVREGVRHPCQKPGGARANGRGANRATGGHTEGVEMMSGRSGIMPLHLEQTTRR